MDPRAGLDTVKYRNVSCPCHDSNLTVQPVTIPTELSWLLITSEVKESIFVSVFN
jgi:hypothetical protein